MLYIFRLLRRFLKVRRRLFKKGVPHWARDLAGLAKYINVFELLITLTAIALSPDHFFGRLPQYISRKKSWFSSPIKFFTQGVTLTATLSFFVGENLRLLVPEAAMSDDYTDSSVYRSVLLYAVLAPLCVPLLSVVMMPFWFLQAFYDLGINKGSFAIGLKRGWIVAKAMSVPALPSTYKRMSWVRWTWSLCYYDVYFFLAAVIVLTPLTILVAATIDDILARDYYLVSRILYLTFVGLLYSGPVYLLVVAPYMSLLRSAMTRPSRTMIAGDYAAFGAELDQLTAVVTKEGWATFDEHLNVLETWVARHEVPSRKELQRSRLIMSAESQKFYLSERTQVLREMLGTERLRALDATRSANDNVVRLLDRIDEIADPTLVVARAIT